MYRRPQAFGLCTAVGADGRSGRNAWASPQPKVSGMMCGDFTNLSKRKLSDCLNRPGYDIEIKVCPTAEAVGHLMFAVDWQEANCPGF
ncbi:MAG: helix-turn-helix domain-containing protein [Azoarcus sp.]|nr:helix-turn-helix domain-containing protein [Azoarcus sp.]